jgi:hypothetical protein
MRTPGEFHWPGPNSFALWQWRTAFLRTLQQLVPEAVKTLANDVFPAARAYFLETDPSAEAEALMRETIRMWQEHWGLAEEWMLEHVIRVFETAYQGETSPFGIEPWTDDATVLQVIWIHWARDPMLYPSTMRIAIDIGNWNLEEMLEFYQSRPELGKVTIYPRGFFSYVDSRIFEVDGSQAPHLLKTPPFTFEQERWIPEIHTREKYAKDVREAFEDALKSYIREVEESAIAAGMVRTPAKYARGGRDEWTHLEWVVRRRVQRWSMKKIAREYSVSWKTAKSGVEAAEALLEEDKIVEKSILPKTQTAAEE